MVKLPERAIETCGDTPLTTKWARIQKFERAFHLLDLVRVFICPFTLLFYAVRCGTTPDEETEGERVSGDPYVAPD